jgi:hypothetical protein
LLNKLDLSQQFDPHLHGAIPCTPSFESCFHFTALFFNVASEGHAETAGKSADQTETCCWSASASCSCPPFLRRLDIKDQLDISESALPVGRTADVFVALRTNGGPSEPNVIIWVSCMLLELPWCMAGTSSRCDVANITDANAWRSSGNRQSLGRFRLAMTSYGIN